MQVGGRDYGVWGGTVFMRGERVGERQMKGQASF